MSMEFSGMSDREIYSQMDDFDEPDDEAVYTCPSCNGTGLAWEGWDCEECDGLGYWEL